MCVCVCVCSTCVWDEADFEEGPNHGGHIASLVVPQSTPLGYHQSVHGYAHVTIAEREEGGGRREEGGI